MPLQGNDNRSTRSWMPKAAIAPSANWNSTYAVHYKNPAKRFSRNHEYWLRKANERAAATEQLAAQGLTLEPRSQTFRNPSLALAYNQPIRSPSTQPRVAVPGDVYGATMAGSLTARPLAASIRDTSFRSHNSFDAHGKQQHYASPYSVSALAALEGQAAASHHVIPNQAIVRPHVERSYRAVGAGHQPPLRPQTAGAARRTTQLTYLEPLELVPDAATSFTPDLNLYRTVPAQAAWSEVEPQPQPMQATLKAPRPAAGLTYRQQQHTANVLARSQTFRPLLTSKSTPSIQALGAASGHTQRAGEWQGGAYQELAL